MTDIDFLAHLKRDGLALFELARAHPDAPITACPDWDMTGLAQHLGQVFSFMDGQVSTQSTEPVAGTGGNPPEAGPEVIEWAAGRLDALLASLAAAAPDAPAWNWTPNQTAGFFRRRAAHETAVHLWDAQVAAGQPASINSDLAADGIDEYLEVGMVHSMSSPDRAYPAQSLHLHRTDGEGEWMIALDESGKPVVTHEHGKGDAAVRGTAMNLLLFVWNRGREDLEIFGSEEVAQAWAAVAP